MAAPVHAGGGIHRAPSTPHLHSGEQKVGAASWPISCSDSASPGLQRRHTQCHELDQDNDRWVAPETKTPRPPVCLRLGAGISFRPALTTGGLPTTVSQAEQTRPSAHAHHRRHAQVPPPWDTTKAVAGVRAVPPSAAGAPGFLQRAMLDLTVMVKAGSGTLKKGKEGPWDNSSRTLN